jgi:RHS repeat-associated protein
MTYPSGRRITNAYDRAGRIVSVTGVAAGVTKSYVSGVSYAPHGALEQVALGANGVRKERSCYNERLQMTGMILGESPAANCGSAANTWFRIGNSFPAGANNGNIQSQEIADQGSWLAIQTFTYDKLDRLEVATEGTTAAGWKQTFGYDRWGNRWLDPDPVKTYPASANGVANGMSWFTAKNRLNIAGGFDLAGNQLYANPFVLSYDAENRLAQAASSTEPLQNRSYGYDGEGRRVTEVVGTAANQRKTFYVYNAFGELAAEYEQVTGSPAPRPAAFCATCYLTADHLGSTRVIWDENGVKARFDYHPFGELISGDRSGRAGVAGYNAGGFLSQKFTGKERDAETGLDYFGARYMSPGQGRFVNPDAPFADQDEEDPQSWNLFAYVANNPLAFIDSNGRGKSKAVVAVIKRLQVGFEQIVVRNEGKNLGRKEAMDRVKQQGDDVIFDSNSAARAAAGGRGAKKHGAHTNTAGPNALPHYHPTNSSGKKGSAHAFIRKGGKILIPGAALGTAFFGDNLFGQTVDLVNPMSDVQEGATLMDEMIVPSIFGFVDKYLMNPPKPKPQERELLPKVEVRICFDDGGCRPSKW